LELGLFFQYSVKLTKVSFFNKYLTKAFHVNNHKFIEKTCVKALFSNVKSDMLSLANNSAPEQRQFHEEKLVLFLTTQATILALKTQ